VIQVLRYLEGRINAMIDIWGLDGTMAAEAEASAHARADAAARMSAPARPSHGLDQADVDIVMGPAPGAAPAHDGEILDIEPVMPAPKPAAPPAPASDPLAPLNALTPEEKIALFS
jgi:chemotaxis protein CheZ